MKNFWPRMKSIRSRTKKTRSVGYIDTGTFDYWTKITLDVKFMAAAWYKAEQAPAEEAEKAEAPVAEPPTQTEG